LLVVEVVETTMRAAAVRVVIVQTVQIICLFRLRLIQLLSVEAVQELEPVIGFVVIVGQTLLR
jgi:hypothetical protein